MKTKITGAITRCHHGTINTYMRHTSTKFNAMQQLNYNVIPQYGVQHQVSDIHKHKKIYSTQNTTPDSTFNTKKY